MGVPQIYARAENLTAGQVLTAVGATDVIYPEIETAQRWAYKLIAPHIEEKIDFAPGYSLARLKAPACFDRMTVMDLQLRQRYNINLVAIKRAEPDAPNRRKALIMSPCPTRYLSGRCPHGRRLRPRPGQTSKRLARRLGKNQAAAVPPWLIEPSRRQPLT
jgi:hypothetical protein